MSDEIKEILDSLKFVIDNPTLEDEVGDEQVTIINYTELNAEESKQLLDYITNLQEKVNKYENPNDLTLFYMWLDEKAKDKMKELQDEIQNLRGSLKTYEILLKMNVEENERLKELCDKYEEEHSNEFKIWKDERQQLLDYKLRCEKAIKCINDYAIENEDYSKIYNDEEKELLDILTGGDKDRNI